MVKEIELTQGKVALVDEQDYQWLSRWKWHAHKDRRTFYARRWDGRYGFLRMHQVILGATTGCRVDHRDGDGLNNTRENLRSCTLSQNQMNRGPQSNNTSGFKGVQWHKATGKWLACLRLNHRRVHLGLFTSKLDAARAYNKAAGELFGEFAWLNPIS